MYFKQILIAMYVTLSLSEGYNILVVFPHPGKSHFLVFKRFFEALATKGHNMTVISFFPKEIKVPNYRDISLLEETQGYVDVLELESFAGSRTEKYSGAAFVNEFAKESCRNGLKSAKFQSFISEHNEFDLILAEFFNTNCFMGLRNRYRAPVIGLSSSVPLPWVPQWFGSPENPSYVPVMFMDYSDHLTFLERMENTLMLLYCKLYYKYYMAYIGNEFSKQYLKEDLKNEMDIMYNSSLLLVNTHFTLNRPKPLVPNIIEVGGIHIPDQKILPVDLEKWINSSSHGVIYFSFGSMIKGNSFPEDKRKAFIEAFKRLPQKVLWKWENDAMEDKPDTIMTQKWMPQLEILCHPNVKVFISHGGLLGITEAVHCGVPVIVMPQYGDQHTNARALEASGGGVILQLSQATKDSVYMALKQVLHPDFRQKAKDLSERFRDRPLPPLETAIYWVEYVARYQGAPHMRTAAVDMPLYKYYLIDVIGFLLFVVCLLFYMLYFIIKLSLRILFSTNKKEKKL